MARSESTKSESRVGSISSSTPQQINDYLKSKTAAQVDLPPPPPNASSIAHNPGAITQDKIVAARTNQGNVEDIITARVTGVNHSTGEAYVVDGSNNQYSVKVGIAVLRSSISGGGRSASAPALVPGQSVVVSRSRSQNGERTVRLITIVPLGRNPSDFTQALSSPNFNELCTPKGTATSISGGVRKPPSPPDEPEDQDDPNPPDPPEPDPNDDEPSDPPSAPFGCNPNDGARWYDGGCPAGSRSLGFAELPGGGTKSLCTGPNLPPGDGCPVTPDTYGWTCAGEDGCQLVPNGQFLTREECEAQCSNEPDPEEDPNDPEAPLRYACEGSSCVASPTGSFLTLAECESACVETWDPPLGGVGPCLPQSGTGGSFTTESACNVASGQCPARTYRISMSLSWQAFNPATGVVESFSFSGGPNIITPSGIADQIRGPLSSANLVMLTNPFFPFQPNYGFQITISGANGFFRWSRLAPFTGVGGNIVGTPTYSATIIANNPSTPCT